MELLKGKVLEDNAYFARIVWQDATQQVVKVFADRALKIRVLDQRDWGILVAHGGGIVHLDLRAGFGQRVPGHVGQVPPKEKPAVLAHIELHGLLGVPMRTSILVSRTPSTAVSLRGPTDS